MLRHAGSASSYHSSSPATPEPQHGRTHLHGDTERHRRLWAGQRHPCGEGAPLGAGREPRASGWTSGAVGGRMSVDWLVRSRFVRMISSEVKLDLVEPLLPASPRPSAPASALSAPPAPPARASLLALSARSVRCIQGFWPMWLISDQPSLGSGSAKTLGMQWARTGHSRCAHWTTPWQPLTLAPQLPKEI